MSRSSISIKVTFIVIGLLEISSLQDIYTGRCGSGEWNCHSWDHGLRCIPLTKFCDGIKNCPDGSDEPPQCTNCNKTYTGKSGIKYPLRVTGPFQRFLPFVCRVNFVAMGGDFGDSVELSFLSFQIGKFEFVKNIEDACQKGFMQIHEHVSSSPEEFTEIPHFGSFCGKLQERSATFFSKSSNVSILIVVPSRVSISTSTFSLFLTFRFLTRTRYQNSYSVAVNHQYGNALPGTFCDRMFLNCHLKPCKIRSPNFPGFYPRNITCNYHIRQMQVPHASVASIVLKQPNEYKIFIPKTGDSSSTNAATSIRSSSLSNDCSDYSDAVKIYDGPTTNMPLLAKFCGDGTMPSVISSGSEVLVQLYSSPFGILCSSKLEIDVSVKFESETSAFMQRDRNRCAYIIDANRHRRQGVINSPKYTMPENSSCSYKFIGSSSYDRIWIYFVSYLSRESTSSPYSDDDDDLSSCTSSKLEIFDSQDRWPMLDFNDGFEAYPTQFCGSKDIPRMCSHAADFPPSFSPGRPCKVPDESYISSGPTYALKHTFQTAMDTINIFKYSHFTARYEFVDTRQDGIAIGRTECDRRFDSRSAKGGFISNSKNVFYYGRGGRENISCAFHFVGLPTERLRITIFNLRLSVKDSQPSCDTQYDNITHRYKCASSGHLSSGRMASLSGFEYWDSHSSTIGCICNTTSLDRNKKYVFDSLVSNVKLIFAVNFMTAFEDYKDFGFEAKFEFFNSTFCDTHVFDERESMSSEGFIEFHVPQGRTNFTSGEDIFHPLRCRWRVQSLTERYLYLQFSGNEISSTHCKEGMVVLVYLDTHLSKPSTKACVVAESNQNHIKNKEFNVFSQSWYNDTYSINDNNRDFIFIEIVANHKWKGIKLHFHWMEVTKPFYRSLSGRPLRNVDCIFECPEIGACIDPHLWCDGVDHCPSGFDESTANCHPLAKNVEYLSMIVITGALVLLFLVLLISWMLVRHRQAHSQDSDDDRTKDCNHRCLTPVEDYQMESPIH